MRGCAAERAGLRQAGGVGTMTRQEAIDFLSVGSRTGRLATASPTGAPGRRAREYGERNAVEGEMLCRVRTIFVCGE